MRKIGANGARRKQGSGTGLKVGLIIGGILLVLLLLGCGVTAVLAIVFGFGGLNPDGSYTVSLAPNTQNERGFHFQAGQRVTVTVTTTRAFGPIQPDVDLFIVHRGRVIASDERIHPDCHVTFIAPANDNYIVRVRNLGPGRATSQVLVR